MTTTRRCGCPRCTAHDSGHRGQPLTPAEFTALGLANEPEPATVDTAVAEAEAEVVAIEALWDVAVQQWETAVQARQRAERTRSGVAAARDAEKEAFADRAAVGARLTEARVRYHAIAKAAEQRRYAEEAGQHQQVQESAAAAECDDQDTRIARVMRRMQA